MFRRQNVSVKPGIKIIFGLYISAEYQRSENRDNHNTNQLENENNRQVPVTRYTDNQKEPENVF